MSVEPHELPHRGACSNPDCLCGVPGEVCEEACTFGGHYCARCGWHCDLHLVRQPREERIQMARNEGAVITKEGVIAP